MHSFLCTVGYISGGICVYDHDSKMLSLYGLTVVGIVEIPYKKDDVLPESL
jgi:hypothetical protein